jgi:hypothetical protein
MMGGGSDQASVGCHRPGCFAEAFGVEVSAVR